MQPSKVKAVLVLIGTGLFLLIAGMLFWFFFLGPKTPVGAGWYLFSFGAGLTMIVLPCTLPLAFVIVPLSMGKGPIKGLTISLAFGIGVALTLSMYGVLAALLGSVAIGSLGAPLEVVKNWLYFIAGGLAYLFALGELGLIGIRMPSYGGAAPAFIQKQKDVVKALMLGLFLGNIGIGCPHPATPVILTRIAVSGNVFYGWLLFFVHAVGRVLPLLLLAVLGILGVDALKWLVARKDQVEKATGWGMVFVAAFIMVLGLFSHDWWVFSGQHTLLEEFTQEERFLGALIKQFHFAGAPHVHGIPMGTGLFGLPLGLGNWVLVFLWIFPMWWAFRKKMDKTSELPEEEKKFEKKLFPLQLGQIGVISVLIFLSFVFILPDRFYSRANLHMLESGGSMNTQGMNIPVGTPMPSMAAGQMVIPTIPTTTGKPQATPAKGQTMMMNGQMMTMQTAEYEATQAGAGLTVTSSYKPPNPATGKPVNFDFFVNENPKGTPITNLEIVHEKPMHVIGVRDDMNEFFHIHPTEVAGSGHFLTTYTFQNPGNYKIWSEVTKDGMTHVVGQPKIMVTGAGEAAKKDVTFGLVKAVQGNTVTLSGSGSFVQKKNMNVSIDIRDAQGKPVQLDQYLGTTMHLSIIKDDFTVFLHVHPGQMAHSKRFPLSLDTVYAHGGEAEEVHGGDLAIFSVTFPTAGIYRAYAQYRPKNANLGPDDSHLATFWIRVEEKAAFPISPWWFLLITSLIAIGVVSYLVRKFLTPPEVKVMSPPSDKGEGK